MTRLPKWRVARYLVARSRGGQRRGLVGLAVLLAVLGGMAMSSIAAARRTDAAYPTYLVSSRASDLQLSVYAIAGTGGFTSDRLLAGQLAALPEVAHVAVSPDLLFSPHVPVGSPAPAATVANEVNFIGSEDGANFAQDRPSLTAGRMPIGDEVVASTSAAQLLGWRLGERVPLDLYSVQQATRAPTFPPPHTTPVARVTVTLVGLVTFANEVAHDDVDRYPTSVLVTPSLTARFSADAGFSNFELRLRHGGADDAVVEREITSLLPPGTLYTFHVTSIVEGQVERAIRPEVIAFAAFGAIAAATALLLGALAVRRRVSAQRGELTVARALGADRATSVLAGSATSVLAIVAGSLVAAVLAVAASPIAPVGPVRAVDPAPGFAVDWWVIGPGVAFLIVALAAITVTFAAMDLRQTTNAPRRATSSRSRLADAAARSDLPSPAVAGLRFALERRGGPTATPIRSALIAAVLAVLVVVATVTFASGLTTLNAQPALYGWNWDDALLSPAGQNLPPVAGKLLDRDPLVSAWSGFTYANAKLNGQTVPILIGSPHAKVGLALIAGHQLDGDRQVVLGAATMAQLHVRLGGTVVGSYGSPKEYPVYVPPTRLTVVGVATMPAIGGSQNLHTSMGVGAEIATGIEPPAFARALHQTDPNFNGPQIELVRFVPGASAAAGLASLRAVARTTTRVMRADPAGAGATYLVVGPQRPAEIAIYQSTGATPAVLALSLAASAIAALGLALTSSVRRRRRDLALLKTLGFQRRQLASTIAWQATTMAAVGAVFGVPLGVVVGRWLWIAFARQIGAVPEPTVPVGQVAIIVAAAVVLANVVAAVPGRLAARTPAALVLRAE